LEFRDGRAETIAREIEPELYVLLERLAQQCIVDAEKRCATIGCRQGNSFRDNNPYRGLTIWLSVLLNTIVALIWLRLRASRGPTRAQPLPLRPLAQRPALGLVGIESGSDHPLDVWRIPPQGKKGWVAPQQLSTGRKHNWVVERMAYVFTLGE
jgi:hypothetical protein